MEALLGLLIVGGVIVFYTISVYNSIISTKNQVKRSWSDVLVYVQKKMKILPELEKQVSSYKDFEKSTLETISRLRSQVSSLASASPEVVQRVEREFSQMMDQIKISVEAYPDLKASEVVHSLMKETVDQQRDISASITIYNRNVESFNNLIQEFPSSMVNSVLNKEKELKLFHITNGVQEEVEFDPQI